MDIGNLSNILYPIISELILAVGALACLLVDMFLKKDSYRISSYIAYISVVLAIYTLFIYDKYDFSILQGLFTLDLENFPFKFLVLLVTLLILTFSDFFLVSKNVHYGEYHFLILISALSVQMVISSENLVMIFFALECASLASYVLCAIRNRSEQSIESAMKYFITGSLAAGMLLYGTSFLYGAAHSMNLNVIFNSIQLAKDNSLYLLGITLVVSGLCVKLAIAPFHWWSLDVYKGAPTPVTAFISTVSKIGVFWLLTRFVIGIGDSYPAISNALLSLALLSILFGAVAAYYYSNLKSILAMSSVNQFGYLLLILVLNQGDSMMDIFFYLTIYCTMSVGILAVLSILESRMDDGIGLDLKDIKGLVYKCPKLSIALLIFLLSFAGIPLTAGFIGKFRIFSSVFVQGSVLSIAVTVIASIISLYYYLRIISNLFQREEEYGSIDYSNLKGAFLNTSYFGVILSVILVIVLGIMPNFFLMLGSYTNF